MKLAKVFQRNAEESPAQGARAQGSKPSVKNPQKPAKKTEGAKKKVARKTDEPRFEWWTRFRQYLREVLSELRKVVWPSRKETIGSTSVVLVLVLLVGIYLGLVDAVLSRFVRLLVG